MAQQYNLPPSSFDAEEANVNARFGQLNVVVNGDISATTLRAGIISSRARILKVFAFRATAGAGVGAGGSTDVDVNVEPLGGSDASILAAAIEFEQSDGDGLSLIATPSTAAAGWDGVGVLVEPGAVVSVVVDAIEAGATPPTGLVVSIQYQLC